MANDARPRTVIVYSDDNGREPIEEWLNSLKDKKTVMRIRRRIDRMALGNFGDYKSVGGGVLEARFFFGAGYRVYFAEDGDTIIVLLCGGDKSTQKKDIRKGQEYWLDYQNRKP